MDQCLLPGSDQCCELIESIKGARVEFRVVDPDPELILHEHPQVYEVERIDQAAGKQRFVRTEDAFRLSQEFRGDVLRQNNHNFVSHRAFLQELWFIIYPQIISIFVICTFCEFLYGCEAVSPCQAELMDCRAVRLRQGQASRIRIGSSKKGWAKVR